MKSGVRPFCWVRFGIVLVDDLLEGAGRRSIESLDDWVFGLVSCWGWECHGFTLGGNAGVWFGKRCDVDVLSVFEFLYWLSSFPRRCIRIPDSDLGTGY